MIESSNDDELKQLINSNETLIIDCYATWCGPCKALIPTLEKIEQNSSIKFIKANIEDHQEIVRKLNIRSVPTLIFVDGGDVQSTLIGFKAESQIQEWIKNNS